MEPLEGGAGKAAGSQLDIRVGFSNTLDMSYEYALYCKGYPAWPTRLPISS